MRRLFIDPGRLSTELILQQAETEEDGAGGLVETWQDVAPVFAEVEPVSARSIFGAGQEHETVTHRVILRHRDDLRSGMRFVKGARLFEIVAIEDADATGRYLLCRTREQGRCS